MVNPRTKNMRINYTVWGGEHWGMQAIDHWYAYRQGWCKQSRVVDMNKEFDADVIITQGDPQPDAFNILFWSRPAKDDIIEDCKRFDMVLFCNGSENLGSGTPAMYDAIDKLDHCFIQSNSVLDPRHPLINQVILSTDIGNIYKWHFEPFYPAYFHTSGQNLNHNQSYSRRPFGAVWVNGTDRSWRRLFQDMLTATDSGVWIKNSISSHVHETLDSHWESAEDTEFRITVNERYEQLGAMVRNMTGPYYEYSVPAGINHDRGEIPPGNFVSEEYYTNRMVIFPETGWQNYELVYTEKMFKCMVAKTVPMPVGGAGIHQLYNDLGIFTAWNLLPHDLQGFDSVLNHVQRYHMQAKAVEWLVHNNACDPDQNSLAREVINNNSDIGHVYTMYTVGTRQFDKFLTILYNQKYEC